MNDINLIKKNSLDMIDKISNDYGKYETLIVNEENYKDIKKVVTKLNKIKNKVEDERKLFKKEVLKPYEEIEPDFKNISMKIDIIKNNLTSGIHTIDENEKNEKYNNILIKFNELNPFGERLKIDKIFKKSWLNKSTSLKSITEELESIIESIKLDVSLIEESEMNLYFDTLDLRYVISLRDKKIPQPKVIKEPKVEKQKVVIEYETDEQLDMIKDFVIDIGCKVCR